jgi:hypothetical protein
VWGDFVEGTASIFSVPMAQILDGTGQHGIKCISFLLFENIPAGEAHILWNRGEIWYILMTRSIFKHLISVLLMIRLN